MISNKVVSHAVAIAASGFLVYLLTTQLHVREKGVIRKQQAAEESIWASKVADLEQRLQAADLERDQYKSAGSEVHKLRSEVSELRKVNQSLQKQVAQGAESGTAKRSSQTNSSGTEISFPESFPNHSALAQFTANLRLKARSGLLTQEERDWLQNMKPELEKLESSPEAFAEFQTAYIQSVAGVNDPAKLDQIRQTIHRVYEAANARGLNLQARPGEDSAWVEQRHQLDRRGTGAVQKILDENERASFDNAFQGIMGVDLGTGVDKSLYPPGFLHEDRVGR